MAAVLGSAPASRTRASCSSIGRRRIASRATRRRLGRGLREEQAEVEQRHERQQPPGAAVQHHEHGRGDHDQHAEVHGLTGAARCWAAAAG